MPSVGEQLRTAREQQQLAIHQVADWTKIRGDHIRALEEGNFSVFSAPVYIRGFVRTYATLLKLDSKQILEQLSVELAGSGQQEPNLGQPAAGILDETMFQFSKFVRRLALPLGLALVVLVGAILGYMSWLHAQKKDPLEGLGPGLHNPPPASETLPLPRSTD
jgi:cytoskeletal protein RodZ